MATRPPSSNSNGSGSCLTSEYELGVLEIEACSSQQSADTTPLLEDELLLELDELLEDELLEEELLEDELLEDELDGVTPPPQATSIVSIASKVIILICAIEYHPASKVYIVKQYNNNRIGVASKAVGESDLIHTAGKETK